MVVWGKCTVLSEIKYTLGPPQTRSLSASKGLLLLLSPSLPTIPSHCLTQTHTHTRARAGHHPSLSSVTYPQDFESRGKHLHRKTKVYERRGQVGVPTAAWSIVCVRGAWTWMAGVRTTHQKPSFFFFFTSGEALVRTLLFVHHTDHRVHQRGGGKREWVTNLGSWPRTHTGSSWVLTMLWTRAMMESRSSMLVAIWAFLRMKVSKGTSGSPAARRPARHAWWSRRASASVR